MNDDHPVASEAEIVDSASLGAPDYGQLDEAYPEPEPITCTGIDSDVEGLGAS